MFRRVVIEKLAPTGEGVSRGRDGVGFVQGALPGEEVEAEVDEVRKRFWRGRASRVITASPDRRYGVHAESCGGCDWAHFDLAAARDAKRELFLETMERIGKLPPAPFGSLPIVPSPAGYRLRSRFHASLAEGSVRIGWFGRRSHAVESAADCEALSEATRGVLPKISEAILSSGVRVGEIAMLEDLDGSRRAARLSLAPGKPSGRLESLARHLLPFVDGVRICDVDRKTLLEAGEPRVSLVVAGREFRVPVDAFFQSNRYLVDPLVRAVASAARTSLPREALDAFAGVGLFAGALLDAGHTVVGVEESEPAVEAARLARRAWRAEDRWRIVRSSVRAYVERSRARFSVTIADPPRGGLGRELTRDLARRTSNAFVYVSCEPATLARDLPVLIEEGWRIEGASLYDLFAFTHRVEALVTLSRAEVS